jgi:HemY protein
VKVAIGLLIVIIFAGILGTLIARDPGYILIVYQDYSLQTSLWVGLFLIIVVVATSYFLWWLAHVLLDLPARVSNWRNEKSKSRAMQFLGKGIALSLAGQLDRATRFLVRASEHHTTAGPAALLLANQMDGTDAAQRKSMWQRALDSGEDFVAAARLGLAKDAITAEELTVAEEYLASLPVNHTTTELKLALLLKMQKWQELADLQKTLRKYAITLTPAQVSSMRNALDRMQTDAERHLWRSALSILTDQESLLIAYYRSLSDQDIAEKSLRQQIDKRGSPALFVAYAELGLTNLSRRLEQIESWQGKFSDNAAYRYCAGVLYALSGRPELALVEYQKSIEIEPSAEVHRRLAMLLADRGDNKASVEQFQMAIKVTT